MAEELVPVNVLSTILLEDEQVAMLESISPRIKVTVRKADEVDDLGDDLEQFEVLYTSNPLPDPEAAPNLRWVQGFWAGVDTFIDHPLFAGDVELYTASGVHAINTAEFAMALILTFARKIPTIIDYQRRIEWPEGRFDIFVPTELYGSTLGIIGYGSIGRHVARLGKGFGMEVLAIKRNAMDPVDHGYTAPDMGDPEGDIADRIYPPQALHSFLGECDFVVLLVPLTAETERLINEDALGAMKESAILINLARGQVLDSEALVKALEDGKIAGAALDVFDEEPLSEYSPLWELPNLILSPHVAGFTAHSKQRALDILAENLRRYLDGEALVNHVDKEKGY